MVERVVSLPSTHDNQQPCVVKPWNQIGGICRRNAQWQISMVWPRREKPTGSRWARLNGWSPAGGHLAAKAAHRPGRLQTRAYGVYGSMECMERNLCPAELGMPSVQLDRWTVIKTRCKSEPAAAQRRQHGHPESRRCSPIVGSGRPFIHFSWAREVRPASCPASIPVPSCQTKAVSCHWPIRLLRI